MVVDVVSDALKQETRRLKRNEYARKYRAQNKSDIIDDASEEKRIAFNLKAKFYRDRRKASDAIKLAAVCTTLPEDVGMYTTVLQNFTGIYSRFEPEVLGGYVRLAFSFIAVALVLFILMTSPPLAQPTT